MDLMDLAENAIKFRNKLAGGAYTWASKEDIVDLMTYCDLIIAEKFEEAAEAQLRMDSIIRDCIPDSLYCTLDSL